MATLKTPKNTKLSVKVETGTTASGGAAYAERTISSIDPALSDDNARRLAAGYGALQKYPVGQIVRQDTSYLEEE